MCRLSRGPSVWRRSSPFKKHRPLYQVPLLLLLTSVMNSVCDPCFFNQAQISLIASASKNTQILYTAFVYFDVAVNVSHILRLFSVPVTPVFHLLKDSALLCASPCCPGSSLHLTSNLCLPRPEQTANCLVSCLA